MVRRTDNYNRNIINLTLRRPQHLSLVEFGAHGQPSVFVSPEQSKVRQVSVHHFPVAPIPANVEFDFVIAKNGAHGNVAVKVSCEIVCLFIAITQCVSNMYKHRRPNAFFTVFAFPYVSIYRLPNDIIIIVIIGIQ